MINPIQIPMPWIKNPRCETCEHWRPRDNDGHSMFGRCNGAFGGVFGNTTTRNVDICSAWKGVPLVTQGNAR